MGIYLYSVGRKDWFAEEEGGYGEIATGLDTELGRRGLPPYAPVAGNTDTGSWFEEKLSPSMAGFAALSGAHLSQQEAETLLGWTVLVPASLDELITLPIASAYSDDTVIAGAPQVLALAEHLAAALELPLDAIPEVRGNLELTFWFLEGEAERLAASRPGPWSADLDTSFYVALYLRAAQHSLRYGCPLVYS